jgi:hypothetical protein
MFDTKALFISVIRVLLLMSIPWFIQLFGQMAFVAFFLVVFISAFIGAAGKRFGRSRILFFIPIQVFFFSLASVIYFQFLEDIFSNTEANWIIYLWALVSGLLADRAITKSYFQANNPLEQQLVKHLAAPVTYFAIYPLTALAIGIMAINVLRLV